MFAAFRRFVSILIYSIQSGRPLNEVPQRLILSSFRQALLPNQSIHSDNPQEFHRSATLESFTAPPTLYKICGHS